MNPSPNVLPQQPPVAKNFGFNGKGMEFFKLSVKNFFFNLFTLGFYRFQAKVKTRQYLWSHTYYKGQPFEFKGQAMDQVRGLGWLIAVGVGLLAAAGAAFLVNKFLAIPFAYAGLALLGIRMRFGQFRYKVRNTSYRNIRGNVSPNAFNIYLKQAIKGTLLTMVTLGIYRSFNEVELMKIKWGNTSWGRQRFEFTGQGKDFFWLNFKGFALTVVTLGFYTPWFLAARGRYMAENIKFMGQNFKLNLTGGQLLGELFLFGFGTLMTLGIGRSWFLCDFIKDMVSRLSYQGEIDFSKIENDMRANIKNGADNAGDALDIDADFDIAV